MKTIFISIFEGAEARATLRTEVVKTLLADPEVRIVLFTKSDERMAYYQKEFADPRLIYEVVKRGPVFGFDRFFARFKFTLLRTASTNLKRKMVLEESRNYLSYLVGHLANFILARTFFIKMARALDFWLVKDATYVDFFDKYQPSLVFLLHLFDEPEIGLLREAKKRRVPSVGLVNSWDKATSRAVLRLAPDKIVVFNGIVRDEMIQYQAINKSLIFISGIPQYDEHFRPGSFSTRHDFFQKIGLPPENKLIVYAPLGSTFSGSDWEIIDWLYEQNRLDAFGKNVSILVRFQPNDFIDAAELARRPDLVYDYPGVRFTAVRGVDWDMSFEDLKHLRDTLYHMDLLVCYASSISIDAAIFDKPVININFEVKKLPLAKSPTQFLKTEHYRKALQTGGIKLAGSKEELTQSTRAYLENSSLDREGRKRLVKEQCYFTDGKSGERLGRFLLEQMK